MATQPTNLPVPSESPRDLKFNAGKIDEFVTSLVTTYIDRFGNEHYTIEGLRWLAQQAIAQYGWIPIGTFQAGATLTLSNQILKDEADGEYYRWDGVFPKSVPSGSTPASAGGVGVGAWISIGDSSLRAMLASSFGAEMIGTESGTTVQNELNNTNTRIDNKTATTPSHVKVFAELPIRPESYDKIVDLYGYSYLYPQGLAFCDEDREIYICAQGTNGVNSWCWIYVFDIDTKALKCTFSAGDYNAEGLHVTYVDGQKYLFILDFYSGGGNGRTGVYLLPVDMTSIDLQRLSPVKSCNTHHYFQLGGYGEQIIIEVNAGSSTEQAVQRRSKFNYYNARDLISTSNPTPIGAMSVNKNAEFVGKRQGIAISRGEIMHGIGSYHSVGSSISKEQLYGCRTFTMSGTEISSFLANPDDVCDLLASHISVIPTRMENEGVAYSGHSGLIKPYSLHIISEMSYTGNGGIVLLEQYCQDDDTQAIDLSSAQSTLGLIDEGKDTFSVLSERPYDRQLNRPLTTLSSILDMMSRDGIQFYKFYNAASSPVIDLNGNPISTSTTVSIHNNNSFTYVINVSNDTTIYTMLVTGDSGGPYNQKQCLLVQSQDTTTRPEFLKSGIVVGRNGLPCFDMYSNSTSSLTAFRFISGNPLTGGNLSGTITFNGTSTTYATSSDEKKKIVKGKYEKGYEKILMIDSLDALCEYEWKTDGSSDYGLLAQRVEKIIPRAVTVDDATGEYFVDYSKLMPDIISALIYLSKRIDSIGK